MAQAPIGGERTWESVAVSLGLLEYFKTYIVSPLAAVIRLIVLSFDFHAMNSCSEP